MTSRRELLAGAATLGAGALLSARGVSPPRGGAPFSISLAQWSLHRELFRGDLDNLEFAARARALGIDAVEYVNRFFMDEAADFAYLDAMRKRAEDAGVRSLLVMCDGEGDLADPDAERRRRAVENHFKWAVAARYLGCHSIRVNAAGEGPYEEQMKRAADSLTRLAELAEPYEVNVIVENHGGLSSNGAWLAGVMELADDPRVGTLPDFGNFGTGEGEYDRYRGVAELMPYAKAVSAKSHDFDEDGEEVHTDYRRMLGIVVDAGYRGHVGIEYEGDRLSEEDGVLATKRLLERVRSDLAG